MWLASRKGARKVQRETRAANARYVSRRSFLGPAWRFRAHIPSMATAFKRYVVSVFNSHVRFAALNFPRAPASFTLRRQTGIFRWRGANR